MPTIGSNDLVRVTLTDDEKPFYCLLEDDRLITKLTVQTDLLLEPIPTPPGSTDAIEEEDSAGWIRPSIHKNDVRLIITVTLRPSDERYGASPFL